MLEGTMWNGSGAEAAETSSGDGESGAGGLELLT
jgi:hypothetical protein